MKVFICGGGSGKQTEAALQRLNEVIDHSLPCLYIPLAMEADQYDSCYEWVTGELARVDIPGIVMVRSAEELSRERLTDYGFLFVGGGNTFRLLHEIKRVNMFEPIREYLENGGIAFGESAGAIIFGADLEACALDDDNKVGLKDTGGFDILGGVSFLCHYTNRSPEQDRRSENHLLEVSKHRTVYALPEEDTLFLNEGRTESIMTKPYYVFENGEKKEVPVLLLKKANPEDLEQEWLFVRDMPEDENGLINDWCGISREDFERKALPQMLMFAEGIALPEGYVPETFYFLWNHDTIVGQFRIRHWLCESLRTGAGHIGYFIAKPFRGKGYGTEGLRLTLEEAGRIVPEEEIYLRVNRDNPASLRVMLRNGGRIVSEDENKYYVRIPNPGKGRSGC